MRICARIPPGSVVPAYPYPTDRDAQIAAPRLPARFPGSKPLQMTHIFLQGYSPHYLRLDMIRTGWSGAVGFQNLSANGYLRQRTLYFLIVGIFGFQVIRGKSQKIFSQLLVTRCCGLHDLTSFQKFLYDFSKNDAA
tara:strand:- start:2440 stop:2850 length:411 start_codon:yes stop_codon:yes gene_type:complete